MRVSRFLLAAGMAVLVGVGSMSLVSAQAKSDEDYEKLMKAVGAANGAVRKATGAEQAAEAAKLVTLAARFESDIRISKEGRTVSGKSIMGVQMLAAAQGSTLTLSAEGDDAAAALDALEQLIARRFDEEA